MSKRLKTISILALSLLSLSVVNLVLAEEVTKLSNPLPTSNIPELIGKIIKYLMGILGSVALVMFLYGGYLWLTAAGRDAQVTKGRETLIWAALGLVLIFASYSIVNFIFGAFTAPK